MKHVTPFGRFMRIKRMDRGMLLIEMSDALGVSPSMLSMVELGRKAVPSDWCPKIVQILALSDKEAEEMTQSISRSNKMRIERDVTKIPTVIAAFSGHDPM